MKIIKYKIFSYRANRGTEESPEWEDVLSDVEIRCEPATLESNVALAKREAYDGTCTVEDDGVSPYPAAPRNVNEGEYVTVDNVLYKALYNIPSGEPIIVGQNAVVTTVEEQLYELTKEE